ncbi:hypothetical protein Arub01_21260 [Actinomadura rubrobrunea]|uniref:Uncharacterized protein n=1 Tax=Actinomadura rubrobrunea TaxID=115335 RepID=A0A9W6PW46_9ACTN|nr:hypothetical protein [Actinomadura rubrobrunea]GLW63882.1 hypothetical protein Arub01_21260 [Actinomadura rubrobrunea]
MAENTENGGGRSATGAPDAAVGHGAAPRAATTGQGEGTDRGPGRFAGLRTRMSGDGVRAVRRRAASLLAGLVSLFTTAAVLVLAVHIVFVAFEANTGNALVRRVAGWAHDLAWQFKDVFQPADPKVEVAVNYGLAALAYLLVGRIAVGLVRRLG